MLQPLHQPLKSPEDLADMRVAGRLASEVLDFITPYVKPGVSTGTLDKLCHDYMVNVQGTVPAPLNYAPPGHRPYPKSICTSVNHQVCHGVPGDKVLRAGDIVNIDVTVIKQGWHGDTSRMFYVGEPSVQARRLCEVTYECMWKGIDVIRPGATLGDIGFAIQRHAESNGFSFTVEPMINAGKRDIRQLADGWTIVTADHSLSAQWEHTVLVTGEGYEVFTVSAGSPAVPAFVEQRAAHLVP